MARALTHVTTASTIEGWTIEAHLGVVASHVVAGTGIFSDFAAGFSDIFGGRSGTYQSQLASLYAEAIGQLNGKAEQLGGNWLIGLRVDIDEISGKGMQMFMVTAMGTAVHAIRILRASEGPSHPTPLMPGASSEDLNNELRRRQTEKAIAGGSLVLSDVTWKLVTQHRMDSAAPAVLTWLNLQQDGAGSLDRPLAYFGSLPPRRSSELLYNALGRSEREARQAAQIITELGLVDLQRVADILRNGPDGARKCAVQTLTGDQVAYTAPDLARFDEVISLLQSVFPSRPPVVESRKLLGGVKERWKCGVCGQAENTLEYTKCMSCQADWQGFRQSDLTPQVAAQVLTNKRDALASLLSEASAG
jgi:uncharacterized protein YbjQ (UPF0145 family)